MQLADRIHLVGSEQFGLSHMLDCNCYLVDGGSGLALIDAGTGLGVDAILGHIEAAGFSSSSLSHVLITHAHLGHWGGAPEIRERTGAEVWAPEAGRYWMEHVADDPTIKQNFEYGRYPSRLQPRACVPDHTFGDGDTIKVGDVEIRTLQVQGHTEDSTCFFLEDGAKSLFAGDVVFYAGALGLINADGCSLSDYRRDIHKIDDLKVDRLLTGHGVFVLENGHKHIARAVRKLSDFVMPDTFFETNEFMWEKDYRSSMDDE